jgi:hypothetical protein
MDDLFNSEMIVERVIVISSTPLFGNHSPLDSMAFVSFVTDVEERVSQISGKDIFIVLSDLEELFPDSPVLTVDMFADYLLELSKVKS